MADTTTSERTSRYRVLHSGISVSSTDSKDRKRSDLYRRGDVVELTAEQAERLEEIGAVEAVSGNETGPNEADRTSLEVTGEPRAANEATPGAVREQRRGPGRPRRDEQRPSAGTGETAGEPAEGETAGGETSARRSGTSRKG